MLMISNAKKINKNSFIKFGEERKIKILSVLLLRNRIVGIQ